MALVKVEYFANDNKVGEKTSAPFNEFEWTNILNPGTYNIYAVAHFDDKPVIISETVTITKAQLDTDYQNVINYATSQSIALPDETQQIKDSDFLINYKISNGWSTDATFFKFTGTAPIAFKLIDWKNLEKAVVIGNVIFGNTGATGNGGVIKTQFIPSNHPQLGGVDTSINYEYGYGGFNGGTLFSTFAGYNNELAKYYWPIGGIPIINNINTTSGSLNIGISNGYHLYYMYPAGPTPRINASIGDSGYMNMDRDFTAAPPSNPLHLFGKVNNGPVVNSPSDVSEPALGNRLGFFSIGVSAKYSFGANIQNVINNDLD